MHGDDAQELVGSLGLQSSRELGDILEEDNAWDVLLEESEKQINEGPDHPNHVAEDKPVSWPCLLSSTYVFFLSHRTTC